MNHDVLLRHLSLRPEVVTVQPFNHPSLLPAPPSTLRPALQPPSAACSTLRPGGGGGGEGGDMSYWAAGLSPAHADTPTVATMEEHTDPVEVNMGAKASLVGGPGGPGCPGVSALAPSPTLENIQAAYGDGQRDTARDLIQKACCVECSAGGPRLQGLRLLGVATQHGDLDSVCYLLREARVPLPLEPSENNPAILAAHYGHANLVKELLDSVPGRCLRGDLLNWMLSTACQQGHMEVVRLLVQSYKADAEDCAVRSDEFAVITGLPLYAAARAGNEEIAWFLLHNGAGFSSYTLMDHPVFSKHLLRQKIQDSSSSEEEDEDAEEDQAVSVCWSGLKLPWLELDWFMDVSSRVTRLDLSSNRLAALPSVVPWGLLRLQSLDLSDNLLKDLPAAPSSLEVLCSSLRQLILSQNQLTSLPTGLLHLTHIQRLIASKNQLASLFHIPEATNWIGLRKLEELDVSDNCLTSLPTAVTHCFKSLRILNVCRNKLSAFPDPWACPLKQCRASSNVIESLPNTMSIFWRTHLNEVDFSDNLIKELPSYIFELESVVSLRLSGNQISALPAPNKWKCSLLRMLDLSRNHLGRTEEGPKTRRLAFLTTWNRRDPDPVSAVEFPIILRDSLEVLFLNDNHLDCVPQSVCGLTTLSELYLSNNPGIRELPVELGHLSNLWQLDIEDLNIMNVPLEVRKEGPMSVMAFLRAHLRKAEPCKLMKLLLIGPPRQGKSALLEALQTGRTAHLFSPPERSISTSVWELDTPTGGGAKGSGGGAKSSSKDSAVSFNVWDIGGPANMSTVNQCFFTDKALYVVIWNLAMGEESVASLQAWLLNIEARAPSSAVVVVGTHLDLIDTKFRTERIATLRAFILALCRSPSGARATGYPDVTWKHLHEVSCKTLEGVEGLKKLIYQVSLNMKDNSITSTSGNRLVGRLIPRSYLALQEAVISERLRRDSEDEVQYLTDAQLDLLIQHNPGSDISDYEDLQTAISFLIETGSLLHFPDTSHGLCMLYFLCPVWLSECLERIIHLKSSRSVARNGLIRTEDLRMLLVGTGFTKQTEEQYFQFLAKFEIALPVANNSFLLPHLLPPKPSMDLQGFRQHSANTLQRLFKMSFVPAGFWERFIARMLISLTEMDLQSFEPKRNARNQRSRNSVIYSFAGTQQRNQRNRCSTFRVRRSHTIYWKEGLLVTFDGGYLSVESSDVNWKRKKSGGIKIVCQSESRDFSAMAFITDHVNSLIEQWFPALTASESDGSLVIEQYAPCPLCASAGRPSQNLPVPTSQNPPVPPSRPSGAGPGAGEATGGRGGTAGDGAVTPPPHYFNMEDCVLAAVDKEHIVCPRHPGLPVPLQELVPELFMTDFPSRLFLEQAQLECSTEETDILGQGGSGTIIYRARYRRQPVAVKRFHFKRCRQQTIHSDTDTMVKHIQSVDACRCFSEFRQEASMLHSLHHPCIVPLVGISIHPLCFALELAPLGSLNAVLEDHYKGSGYMPLGHMFTFKAAYQIAAGLAYLHRKNIIFCDLKSDNILVWSLEVDDPVNIKLSDYGISRQSFHEGALGVEGTPGYQAPEVRPGIVYDEKVDMFSYGMVLYELLSGRRPALGHHQLQIAKKLSKGVRPPLGSPEEVQFHCLHSMLTACWDTKPEKRPLAAHCMRQMQEPSFACLQYLLPCDTHSQLFLSHLQGGSAVFWDGEKDGRNYSVVDVEKGHMSVKRMECPGSRLSCQMKMDNTLWTATEEQEVFIYSLKEMCPLSQPQIHFSSPAVVTCLFPVPAREQSLARVFAGMADGLVAVYTLVEDLPVEGETYLCSHTLNKTAFGLEDTDPRQRPYPVRSMVLVAGGSQLWISNGPGVLVLDYLSLGAVRRLDPYGPPSSIVALASSLALWGDEAVWTLDDHTNTLLLYHAASYQLCARYSCGDSNPLRDVFAVRRPAGVTMATTMTTNRDHPRGTKERGGGGGEEEEEPRDEEDWTNANGEVTLTYRQDAGTQILRRRDSLTDYCSMTSSESSSDSNASSEPSPASLDRRSSSGVLSSLTSTGSMPLVTLSADTEDTDRTVILSTDTEDTDRTVILSTDTGDTDRTVILSADTEDTDRTVILSTDTQDTDRTGVVEPQASESDVDSAVSSSPTPPHLQAFTVLSVNGTLWIPRRGGDVMVIEMQAQAEQLRGRVIAVLSPPGGSSLGTLEEAALGPKDTVVCGFRRQENMRWCLCVWRGWGSRELELFYHGYEELGRAEASGRRRR